jgi:hypothetical protein
MSLTIKRQKDTRVVRAFLHKLADIPDGVTVASADFTQKKLSEGTAIGKDANGLYHVVKVAALTAAATATATTYNVEKGHNFKVGDFIMLKEGGKAYAITAIDTTTNTSHDVITVGTTLGVTGAIGDAIYQAAAESADTTSKFLYEPSALVGESYDVEAESNLIVNAWLIGVIREANIKPLGSAVKAKLTGIQFI